jgi:uncharacterized protein YgbK (DUF1537 family)
MPSYRRLVIQCTGDETDLGEIVAERFAAGVAALARNSFPRTLLLSGGDTAAAILKSIGVERLEVCGEAAPGVAWFMVPMEFGGISVISKSGGFGDPDSLSRIFPALPPAEAERVSIHGSH